jgi:Glycosyl hydrolases family 35
MHHAAPGDCDPFTRGFVLLVRCVGLGLLVWAISATGYPAVAPTLHLRTPYSLAPGSSALHLGEPRWIGIDPDDAKAKDSGGVEIVDHAGYPELIVDGAPFFIHSAAFFYYRIPRDQWEPMLERYRSLGVNTIDLYIPWNWHEPKEGELDFDGHTNPRRDLRALLAMIAQTRLHLIARPGPEILNEWRHGGYPGWLLERPEYQMNAMDWIEGRYPPLDGLNARDAEAAAEGWLGNAVHMAQTRAWFAAAGKELAPYSSHRMVTSASDDPNAPPRDASGPLLFVQLGDDFAINRTNRAARNFWHYVGNLREMIEAEGVDVPVFINATDMRISAEGAAQEHPIGAMGQWYMPSGANSGPAGRQIDASDAGEIEFYTEELKTQPDFPPVMIEYQAGWYAPGEDDRPPASSPENTLLSSRLLIGNGIHGFNYFPLQDTYTPAGYSVPWANQSYRWDAALDANGDPQPRLQAVQRNSRLLGQWGPQLAASHKRADFGIVYAMGAYPQELLTPPDVMSVSETAMRIERLGTLAILSSELLDPEYQRVEQLQHDALLFLPVADPAKPKFQLSDRAQQTLVEYVNKGGTLVIFPVRPAGKIIEELWKGAPTPAEPKEGSAIRGQWRFGDGEVIESSRDFLSWIAMNGSLSKNRAQTESDWAIGALLEFMRAAGLRAAVEVSGNPKGARDLFVNEIVTNEGTGPMGDRVTGKGFLSVTNISGSETAEEDLSALSPSAPARRTRGVYIPVHVVVPPRESLLLPLEAPLCSDAETTAANAPNTPCTDAVESSSAELLRSQRDGKMLELTFYVPTSSNVLLHLARHPSHVTLEGTTTPEAHWTVLTKELEVTIPRGAAPHFLRTLRVELPYTPQVPEIEKPSKPTPNEFEYSVWNALTLPVSANTFLRTYPPLVAILPDQPAAILFSGVNHNTRQARNVNISITGPLRGSDSFTIPEEQSSIGKIILKSSGPDAMALMPESDGLLHGAAKIRSGRDQRTIPIAFLQLPKGQIRNYRFDFDRDGADEWVLESDRLRLILSPDSGGRAIALADKSNGANLTTSVGLLRDAFSYTENSSNGNPLRARGRYGLFNRAYFAEWLEDKNNPGLKLRDEASDVFPSGVTVEKSIRFDGAEAIQVEYHVTLNSLRNSEAISAAQDAQTQSFVAINSFPTGTPPNEPTRFCWQEQMDAGKPHDESSPSTAEDANHYCEDFSPGGKLIEMPAGARSVEIRNAGRPTTEISWECAEACARMTIDQKNFSALFRLQFPVLAPGTDAHYKIKILVLPMP